MIAVNTDTASQRSSLRAFSSRHGISSPIISGAGGRPQQLFQLEERASSTTARLCWCCDDTNAAVAALLQDSAATWLGEVVAQQQ